MVDGSGRGPMKALIRNEGETVTEADGIEGIDWSTGAPLTNVAWCGGPYVLVANYVAPKDDAPESYEVIEPEPEVEETEDPDIIVIDGKQYTKEELRALIGE